MGRNPGADAAAKTVMEGRIGSCAKGGKEFDVEVWKTLAKRAWRFKNKSKCPRMACGKKLVCMVLLRDVIVPAAGTWKVRHPPPIPQTISSELPIPIPTNGLLSANQG